MAAILLFFNTVYVFSRGYGTNGEGVLHTIYTEGACAERWKQIMELKGNFMDFETHKALEAMYGVEIPKPIDTVYQYWDSAW